MANAVALFFIIIFSPPQEIPHAISVTAHESYAWVEITVDNRDYHHLSHSEIAGDKRTSKPCSFSESTAAILGQCGHSEGTEDSLHCGTEDEIVLPVLFITGAAQSGSELRPMPRPVQERVRKAFAAAGLNVCRGHRK